MDENAVIRVVRSGPEVLPAEWAQDRSLSFGARGLLAEVLAHGGEWDVEPEDLARLEPEETAESIQGYVAELERAGYMQASGE